MPRIRKEFESFIRTCFTQCSQQEMMYKTQWCSHLWRVWWLWPKLICWWTSFWWCFKRGELVWGPVLPFGRWMSKGVAMAVKGLHSSVASTCWVTLLACQYKWGKYSRLHPEPYTRIELWVAGRSSVRSHGCTLNWMANRNHLLKLKWLLNVWCLARVWFFYLIIDYWHWYMYIITRQITII